MNRRSFLTRLGVAAVGAAALTIDPERLLWIPGAKTIIDFGATKQVLPATELEVLAQAKARFLAEGRSVFGPGPLAPRLTAQQLAEHDRKVFGLDGPRDTRLDIGGVSFHYKDEQLVSLHTEQELKLLDLPIGGRFPRASAAEIELFHHLDD